MALLTTPFQPLAASVVFSVGSATTTMTFSPSVLGYPSVRLVNVGTVAAFIQFINTSNTTTVGITNAVYIAPSHAASIFGTGGNPAMAALCGGTFTTTIFVTPGQGAA